MSNYLDRPLIEYIPDILKEVREYQALIIAEQPEIFKLFAEIENVLDNQFVKTSTEYGVGRWEKLLGIVPKATLTLTERKSAILARLTEQLPFTYRMLEQIMAELWGRENFKLDLNVKNYTLKVQMESFSSKKVEAVSLLLKRICPANLVFILNASQTVTSGIYISTSVERFTHMDIKPSALRSKDINTPTYVGTMPSAYSHMDIKSSVSHSKDISAPTYLGIVPSAYSHMSIKEGSDD